MRRVLIFFMLASFALTAMAQRTVTGTVTDEQGKPVEGATVLIKGSRSGTATDASGQFSLPLTPNARTLVVSSINFRSREVTIGTNESFNISLVAGNDDLDEVVVVAYGTAKKGTFTGTTAQISAKEIENRPLSNVTNALTGAAPGVQTTNVGGQPGAAPAIRVRGFGSINASSAPLFVVDGVPYDGSIANLNMDDVENIAVLKDAASAALYGSRAANGVVMITTKRGKKNVNRMSFKMTQGVSSRGIPEYDRVDAFQYLPLMWEADRNGQVYGPSLVPIGTASQNSTNRIINQLGGYNPFNVPNNQVVDVNGQLNPNAQLKWADDLDWTKELMRQGRRQEYGLTFTGGTDKSDYFVSLGYLEENGFTIRSDIRRFNGRVNLNVQPTKWFKSGVNLSGNLTNSNQASDGSSSGFVNPFNITRNVGPIFPVYARNLASGELLLDAGGNPFYDLGFGTRTQFPGRHVIAETKWNRDDFKRDVLSARAYGTLIFTKALKFTTNISTDIQNTYTSQFENREVGDGAPGGRSFRSSGKTNSYTFNQLLEYSNTFGLHSIEALAGHENYDLTFTVIDGRRVDQILDGNTELQNFTTISSLNGRTDRHTIESYFGRVNYSFDDKYMLSGSVRRDGNSRFAPESRWGTFWSIGGGWRIDRENFMANNKWIDQLKLRASYGTVGNDAGIGYFPYQGLYSIANNANEPGFRQANLENRSLTWEVNKQFDVALDFAILKNRLSGTVEFFNRASDALIFDVPLPLSSGMQNITRNIGSMYNRGIEIQLSADVVRNRNFSWNVNFNATTLRNRITRLPDGQSEIISGTKKLMVGRSIYDFWLREWMGVDPDDGAALYRASNPAATNVRIKGGDTVSTSQNNARFHYNGSAIPDVFGGITNTLRYKAFEFSFMFTYQIGGKVYDGNYAGLMHSGTYGPALHTDILGRWRSPGDITNVPRMDNIANPIFSAASDRWLVDASFLNLRTLSFAYTVPQSVLKKIQAQSARVFLGAENLGLFAYRKGMDVNQSFAGTTSNSYPPARIVNFGLNVNF